MRIYISYPPLTGKGKPMLSQNRQFQWFNNESHIFPVILGYAATLLKKEGHEVFWNDSGLDNKSWLNFFKELVDLTPDIIVFETKTPVINQHWEIIKKIKGALPEIKIILLGDHVTWQPLESFLKCPVDFVVEGGNYDFGLLSIINFLKNKKPLYGNFYTRDNGSAKLIKGSVIKTSDIDGLPFIDRKLTKAESYGEKWRKGEKFYYLMAGRDCHWGKCTFCAWTSLFKNYLCMSPDRLLKEIDFLVEEEGCEEIFDDSGTFPTGEWLKHFCKEFINKNYRDKLLFSCNMRGEMLTEENCNLIKKAGFRKIKVGFESVNFETLKILNKNLDPKFLLKGLKYLKGEVAVHLTVMVGYPWETREETEKTFSFVKEAMDQGLVEMLQATVLIPYPGTQLFEKALAEEWFSIDPFDYEAYDMRKPVLKNGFMSEKEIMEMSRKFYKLFYSPGFLLNRLYNIKDMSDIKYLFRGVKAISGHLKDFLG